jgi:mannose-6-phosphate isomerase-like protein (cupin superfamily)
VIKAIVVLSLIAGATVSMAQASSSKPKAKVIKLDAGDAGYLRVLSGPPETVTMKSGLVILSPHQSVGRHSTERHEELLVVLEGKGQMVFANGSTLPVEANSALYCPPMTEHDVKNTGTIPLRYAYVVADAK